MAFISTEVFAKNCIHAIEQLKKGRESVLWIRIKDLGEKLDIKNIFDSFDKEIKGKFKVLIPQNSKLKNKKSLVQNLLKVLNLFMHMKML